MAEATLSAKNQIVIPREARQALQVKPGDKLMVVVRGKRVIVLEKPKSHHAAIRGLARGVYSSAYLQKERQSWDWGISAPDALQAATAEHSGATGFITNDAVFERVKTFETLVLERLLWAHAPIGTCYNPGMPKCPYCKQVVTLEKTRRESADVSVPEGVEREVTGWIKKEIMYSCPHCDSILGFGFFFGGLLTGRP